MSLSLSSLRKMRRRSKFLASSSYLRANITIAPRRLSYLQAVTKRQMDAVVVTEIVDQQRKFLAFQSAEKALRDNLKSVKESLEDSELSTLHLASVGGPLQSLLDTMLEFVSETAHIGKLTQQSDGTHRETGGVLDEYAKLKAQLTDIETAIDHRVVRDTAELEQKRTEILDRSKVLARDAFWSNSDSSSDQYCSQLDDYLALTIELGNLNSQLDEAEKSGDKDLVRELRCEKMRVWDEALHGGPEQDLKRISRKKIEAVNPELRAYRR